MRVTLNNILHYSYDPGCRQGGLPDAVAESASVQSHQADEESLCRMAVDAFREAMATELRDIGDDATHVVPLSAGLDSRAILAVLLEQSTVDRSQVQTITYGCPGTWDYEIGKEVAAAAGVQNTRLDASGDQIEWSLEAFRAYAATRDCPGGLFDGYVNRRAMDRCPEDCIIWKGTLGDPTAGGHQPRDPCEEWDAALAYFADHEQFAAGLTAPGFDPRTSLPEEPYISRRKLSYEEQLDFALRQQCAIAPVMGDGERYRHPFTNSSWLAFSLNLPAGHRRGRSLFTTAFTRAYPDLFSLPTDANAGYPPTSSRFKANAKIAALRIRRTLSSALGLAFTHPGTNYVDFEAAFRSGVLEQTAKALIDDFAARDVADWLSPREIWESHQRGTNRSAELQVMCYAELYLSESRDRATPQTRARQP